MVSFADGEESLRVQKLCSAGDLHNKTRFRRFLLVSLFEKELRANFTKIDKETFYNSLPTVIVNNLELASNFEIEDEKELIHVKINDSLYRNLYSKNQNLKSVHFIGCPLISAVACALAKTTGKLVAITKSEISPDLKTVEIWCRLVEG